MKVSEAFPSKWIASADLNDRNIKLTIARVEIEKVGDDTKPVLYFQKAQKGLVLNKVNSQAIAAIYGDEMDDWPGSEVVLFPIMTEYQGKTVPAVRVRGPLPKDNPKQQFTKPTSGPQPRTAEMPADAIGDDIPF